MDIVLPAISYNTEISDVSSAELASTYIILLQSFITPNIFCLLRFS